MALVGGLRWPLRRPTGPALWVAATGVAISVAVSVVVYQVNAANERRLLRLQVEQAATVTAVSVPALQTPLASAAELASGSDGDAARFRGLLAPQVGQSMVFAGASLWQLAEPEPRRLTQLGASPYARPELVDLLRRAARDQAFEVVGPLGPINAGEYRMGYAFASADRRYVVYAESVLPPDRVLTIPPDSPFRDLRLAVYFGASADPATLLETNSTHLPIRGRTVTTSVRFGTATLTFVGAAGTPLGGTLSAWRWLAVLGFGCGLSVAAGFVAGRLVRRREAAEALAGEVADLLSQQRHIALSLQHALLPQRLPQVDGIELAVRYVPGVNDVEIGGDWYDVIRLDERRVFFVVGDVSGRGVGAGAVMASLQFAIRGFVSEGYSPSQVLDALAGMLDLIHERHFATVLCGIADVPTRELTLANAGHLAPLVIAAGESEYVPIKVGPPIGVGLRAPHPATTLTLPPGATMLVFTDGLIERRGESIDVGMQRLRDVVAAAGAGTLEELLEGAASTLRLAESDDDAAVLAIRWP